MASSKELIDAISERLPLKELCALLVVMVVVVVVLIFVVVADK